MFEIIVKADNYLNNMGGHVKIKIKELKTKQIFIVNFSPKYPSPTTKKPRAITKFDAEVKDSDCCQPEAIKLYSDVHGSLNDFIIKINQKYDSFGLFCENCSDACNFTLNYFFPICENTRVERIWLTYKAITCLGCIGTLGFIPFLGSPVCLNAPFDIVMKARWLARAHGQREALGYIAGSRVEEEPHKMVMK